MCQIGRQADECAVGGVGVAGGLSGLAACLVASTGRMRIGWLSGCANRAVGGWRRGRWCGCGRCPVGGWWPARCAGGRCPGASLSVRWPAPAEADHPAVGVPVALATSSRCRCPASSSAGGCARCARCARSGGRRMNARSVAWVWPAVCRGAGGLLDVPVVAVLVHRCLSGAQHQPKRITWLSGGWWRWPRRAGAAVRHRPVRGPAPAWYPLRNLRLSSHRRRAALRNQVDASSVRAVWTYALKGKRIPDSCL